MVTNSDVNSLGTFNATFTDLLHAQIALYSTSDNQGWNKTGQFITVVRTPSYWQNNIQTPGIFMLSSYLCLIFLSFLCDSIQCIKILSMKIKYDDSRNRNNCNMRTIPIMIFDSIKNHNSYLCLIFFVLMWLNSIYCFVLSLRIEYDDSKNQNNCVMRTISIVILIWSKIYVNSGLLIFPTKSNSKPNNII